MIALCPNGKKHLFITDDVEHVSDTIHCSCEDIAHSKRQMIFNPTEDQLEEAGYRLGIQEI